MHDQIHSNLLDGGYPLRASSNPVCRESANEASHGCKRQSAMFSSGYLGGNIQIHWVTILRIINRLAA